MSKRDLMLQRAWDIFVTHGYIGTSTDQLAAAASVSKQTLYREFGDKQGVFAALIEYACDQVQDPFAPLRAKMRECDSASEAVCLLAEQLMRSIMNPRVQQLRRLVIAEAGRFPDLGLLYWEKGFLRVIASISHCLQVLHERQLLDVPDTELAAHHFAGLLLWIPSNQVMFAGQARPLREEDLARVLDRGVEAFVSAYAPRGTHGV